MYTFLEINLAEFDKLHDEIIILQVLNLMKNKKIIEL